MHLLVSPPYLSRLKHGHGLFKKKKLSCISQTGAESVYCVLRRHYRYDDRKIMVPFSAGTRDFYIIQNLQSGHGAHLASYSVGIWSPFPYDYAVKT